MTNFKSVVVLYFAGEVVREYGIGGCIRHLVSDMTYFPVRCLFIKIPISKNAFLPEVHTKRLIGVRFN